MGLTLSKSTTPRELANYLEGLGPAYSRYAEAVLENLIDGSTIISSNSKGEVSELLEDLGVSRLHIKFLSAKILEAIETAVAQPKAASSPSSTAKAGGGPSSSSKAATSSNSQPHTHCFLTHNWGPHPQYVNHWRVAGVNTGLQGRGFDTWFDSDRMQGSVQDTMAAAIEHTKCVVVFITATYHDKVNGTDLRDNCKFEFSHAVRQLGPQKMVPVVMEKEMRNSMAWKGIVGANLGGLLYVDMCDIVEGTAAFEAKVQEIADRVKAIVGDGAGAGGDAKGETKAATAPATAPAPAPKAGVTPASGEAKVEAKPAPAPAPVRAPAQPPSPSYVYPSGSKANLAVPDGVGRRLYDAAQNGKVDEVSDSEYIYCILYAPHSEPELSTTHSPLPSPSTPPSPLPPSPPRPFSKWQVRTLCSEWAGNTAAINWRYSYGYTPLNIACVYDHHEVVSVLIGTAGVDLNMADNWGQSPLWIAAANGRTQIVRVLLSAKERGLDLNQKPTSGSDWGGHKGKTPLKIAREKNKAEVVALLEAAGARDV